MKLTHLEVLLRKTINLTLQQENRITKFMNKSGRKGQLDHLQQLTERGTIKPQLQTEGIIENKNKLVGMQGIIEIQSDNQRITINMEELARIRNQLVGIGLTELVITTIHKSIASRAIKTAVKLNKFIRVAQTWILIMVMILTQDIRHQTIPEQ